MTTKPASTKKSAAKTTEARKPSTRTPVRSAAVARPAAVKPARTRSAGTASLPEQAADIPILPVEQLERLHAIKPDAVDWVIRQTQIEAEHRREETSRVNGFVFFEHLFGQFSALVLGAMGIIGGSWVALNGQPWAGVAVAAAVIAGLALVFLSGRKRP